LRLVKRKFKEIEKNTNLEFFIIVGNHDVFYKNTNKINSPHEVFSELNPKRFHIIYNEPMEIRFGDSLCLFVPWMSKDSFDSCLKTIQKSPSDYCFGHFEINGFVMNNNNTCKSVLKKSHFKNFKKVFSGHFHTRSSIGNVIYTGSLCELDWNDFDVKKGFYLLETDNNKIRFINSGNRIFRKLLVGENFNFDSKIKGIKDSYLKIYINKKLTTEEDVKLGIFITQNISYEIIDNTILDDVDISKIDKEEDLSKIIISCVNSQDNITDSDKKRVISLLNASYEKMKQEEDE
jgi:DNA repair exonuclease SbcCD nuclease subunit